MDSYVNWEYCWIQCHFMCHFLLNSKLKRRMKINWLAFDLLVYLFSLFLFAIKKMLARIANFNNDRPHDRQSNIFMFNTKWTNLI